MGCFDFADTFIACVKVAEDSLAIHHLLDDATRDLGFDYFALIHHTDLRRSSPDIVRVDSYPTVWAEHFIGNQLYLDDPVLRAAAMTAIGFPWSAVPTMIKLRGRDRQILESAGREGIGTGFTVPFNVPGERRGSCSFATRSGRGLPTHALPAAQLVGLFAFEAARRLSREGCVPTPLPRLSRRQRECLILAGQGKSDGVIAQLLGLSENTVANYLAAARARYGVATRVQLVACALFDGEISFVELGPGR